MGDVNTAGKKWPTSGTKFSSLATAVASKDAAPTPKASTADTPTTSAKPLLPKSSTNLSLKPHKPHPLGGQKISELVVALQKQSKIKKAQGDPEALRRIAEEDEDNKCMQCLEVFGKAGLNHIILYVIMVLYSFLGAAIFEATEETNEIATREARYAHLNDSVLNLTRSIMELDASVDREREIKELLRGYQVEEDLLPNNKRYWDFWGALFFAGTIFTTIGYGHYSPVTLWGKVATMLYAVVGIPLVLAILADLGKLLAKFFKRIYNYLIKLKRCRDRKRWAAMDGDTTSYLEASQGAILSWVNSDDLDIPIPVAILIFVGWIVACSLIFCIWETEWDFFTAFYFFFISLTTIGLGDVTPDHPRYMIFGCGFVIVGLSLISMVINIMQSKLEKLKEATADYLEEELGWDTESGSESSSDEEPAMPVSLGIFGTGGSQSDSQSNVAKAMAEKWKTKAKVDEKRRHKRRRRCVQTDYSYLREMARKYPGINYLDLPEMELYKSRDDVNSLIETLE